MISTLQEKAIGTGTFPTQIGSEELLHEQDNVRINFNDMSAEISEVKDHSARKSNDDSFLQEIDFSVQNQFTQYQEQKIINEETNPYDLPQQSPLISGNTKKFEFEGNKNG